MARRVYDWKAIQMYRDDGHSFLDCQKCFAFSHTAWVKAIKRGELDAGERVFADRRRKYDWSAVQAYYDEGHSYRQCKARFGFNALTWHKARLRGEIRTRPKGKPIAALLETSRSRAGIKRRLLQAGLLANCCQECGISEWRGKPLSIHIDHVNGIASDYRLDNLRMLCPNCHSQTATYGGRNARRGKPLQEHLPPV